jgi:hypothetical protein
MDLVIEYRRRAEECRELARSALSDRHETFMLKAAKTWERLANEREAHLKEHPEDSDPVVLPWRKI